MLLVKSRGLSLQSPLSSRSQPYFGFSAMMLSLLFFLSFLSLLHCFFGLLLFQVL